MTAESSLGVYDVLAWLLVIGLWGALGYRSLYRSASRGFLVLKWIVSAVLISIILFIIYTRSMVDLYRPLALLLPAGILGLIWAPSVANIMVKSLVGSLDGGEAEGEAPAFYYIAETKRGKGQYQEAIAEVRKQLENFPGDVPGMMLLAAIQAEDLHDLPAASATINELLAQQGLPPGAAVAALQTLADWQLQIGHDSTAARATLERILELYPDSSFSHGAQQRLAHLAGADQTREFRENAVFKVTAGRRDIGLTDGVVKGPPEPDDDALAAEYVSQLERHPNDTDAREKLAMLYAEKFQRLDLAADQLEQLVALPNESTRHIAHWLDLLATLNIHCGGSAEAAESALRRIIERFPNTASASQAATRLAMLPSELKSVRATAFKPLGIYEKNLGLKRGPYDKQ
jgi:tetratricopeptide (TPR) repeat protein